ncbi:sialic acid-binding Ig-like lectin 14 [Polymixia lowei]
MWGSTEVNIFAQGDASSWTAEIPNSVTGLLGSCVVIPCSFDYPAPNTNNPEFTGMWTEETNHIIYHPDVSKVMQNYRNRAEIIGDLRRKNCSLKINPLRLSDTGPFHFRIEIKDYDKFSYKQNKVSITIMSTPEPNSFHVKEEVSLGEAVSASCSVSHSCPTDPPVFTWSLSGEVRFQSEGLDDGRWEATSSLTFHPTLALHNKALECTVTYRGGPKMKSSKVLKVKYAPLSVKVEYKSNVMEGEDIQLRCSSDGYPAAHSYQWYSDSGALLYSGHVYLLRNISRHIARYGTVTIGTLGDQGDLGFSDVVHCYANNTLGNATLTLSLPTIGKMQIIYIAVATVAFLMVVIFLMALTVTKKCSSRGSPDDQPTSCMQDMKAAKATELSSNYSAIRKGLKNTDNGTLCNDDTNEHMYGNVQAKWDTDDDAVYANT